MGDLSQKISRVIELQQRKLERYKVTLETLEIIFKEIEQHCPCGARPESPNTHPHVLGCPVERGLLSIKVCKESMT